MPVEFASGSRSFVNSKFKMNSLLVCCSLVLLVSSPSSCTQQLNLQEEQRDAAVVTDQQTLQQHEVITNPDLQIAPGIKKTAQEEDVIVIDEEAQVELTAELLPESMARAAKSCVPMLDLSSFFHGSVPSASPPESSQNVSKTSTSPLTPTPTMAANASYSFNIEDIDMPIAQSGGSIHSAMKFLSSFGSQIAGETEASDEELAQRRADNLVKFRDNRLDIQGLNLTMLSAHLFANSDPKFAIGIAIKNTTLSGRFYYNGPTVLTDSGLSAYYRMSIENIYLVGSSNLTKHLIGQVNVNSTERKQYILATNDFKLNVSNLGYITIDLFDSNDSLRPSSNYILRMVQRVLQKTIKRTYFTFEDYIRNTLEVESRRALDCELTRFTPLLDTSGANNHQSDLARIINSEIKRSHFDTVPLPDFHYQQNILGSSANIHLYNGSLSGLDHLVLNGDTRVKLQDQHLLVNASIGWLDLKPYYGWSLFIGANSKTPTTKGFVSFNIKLIDFDAVISKGLRPRTKILVEQLVIRQLDSPKMDMSGLPGMNRVTRGMVNFFMGRLKQRLASSIQPALKNQLERSLNKMGIFS